jgi:hypothetical protein
MTLWAGTRTIGVLPDPSWATPFPKYNNDPSAVMFPTVFLQGLINSGQGATVVNNPEQAARYETTPTDGGNQGWQIAGIFQDVWNGIFTPPGGDVRTGNPVPPPSNGIGAGTGLFALAAILGIVFVWRSAAR